MIRAKQFELLIFLAFFWVYGRKKPISWGPSPQPTNSRSRSSIFWDEFFIHNVFKAWKSPWINVNGMDWTDSWNFSRETLAKHVSRQANSSEDYDTILSYSRNSSTSEYNLPANRRIPKVPFSIFFIIVSYALTVDPNNLSHLSRPLPSAQSLPRAHGKRAMSLRLWTQKMVCILAKSRKDSIKFNAGSRFANSIFFASVVRILVTEKQERRNTGAQIFHENF